MELYNLKKGIIALDIDGTLTQDKSEVSSLTVSYLEQLAQEYCIIFITGRSFHWSYLSLKQFSFPYLLAVQNGALILSMPTREILMKSYLDTSILSDLDLCVAGEPSDYVIFSGYDHEDLCYYRPSQFDPNLLQYVLERAKALKETWIDTSSYDKIKIDFASVKCFGERNSLERIAKKIERLHLHAPLVHDPIHEGYFVLQATHANAFKGEALRKIIQRFSLKGIVIAAGDDENDQSMLEMANRKIVMGHAPKHLKEIADIVTSDLIEGLKKAVK